MNNTALAQIRKWQTGENRYCFECQTASPTWASLPYGIYLCYNCSGNHRAMGVYLSFVRSIEMDSWQDKQLQMMQLGGNQQLRQFFSSHNISIQDQNKYKTNAAKYYRERMKAIVNETEMPQEPSDWNALDEIFLQPQQSNTYVGQQSLQPTDQQTQETFNFWDQAQIKTKQTFQAIDDKLSQVDFKKEAQILGQQISTKTKELGDKSTKYVDKAFKSMKKGFMETVDFLKSKTTDQTKNNQQQQQVQQQQPQIECQFNQQQQAPVENLFQFEQKDESQNQQNIQQKPIQQQMNLIDYEEYFQEGPTSIIIFEKQNANISNSQSIQQTQQQQQQNLLDFNDEQIHTHNNTNQQTSGVTNLLDL